MSFHIAAYTGLVGVAPDTQINAVVDNILPTDNAGNYLPQENMKLILAYALSATAQRAKISSPAYRQVNLPYIEPIIIGTQPGTLPPLLDLTKNPLRVPAFAPLGVLFTSGIAMGTEQASAILALEQNHVPAPMGDIYTLRAIGTTTLVPFTWTAVPLTFDQPIIQGRYSVVGGNVVCATGIAFRITMDGYYYRPGGTCGAAFSVRPNPWQMVGTYGEWGQFQNTSLPRLEIFAGAADTAETLFLQVIKIG